MFLQQAYLSNKTLNFYEDIVERNKKKLEKEKSKFSKKEIVRQKKELKNKLGAF